LLALLLVGLSTATAAAQVEQREHRSDRVDRADVAFDETGWTLLGKRNVRKKQRDTLEIGAYEGRFDQIMLVVDGSAMYLKKLTVFFENGKKFSPKVKVQFQRGDRSRAIDLPGNDRRIAKIELKYDALARGARSQVRVYGRDTRAGQDPAPPPVYTPPVFDSKGWEALGERTVDGKHDHDVLDIGRDDGRFTKVQFVVYDSDVVFDKVTITFGNGETMSSANKMVFAEGTRTGAIDLAGEQRFIKKIEFHYSNLPGSGQARVAVFGLPGPKDEPAVKQREHRKHRKHQ
jgi:hypothetical protein